ncbi:MAG: vWA domain-containing protein [bacterium]
MRTKKSIATTVVWLSIAPALFYPGITEGAGRIGDSRAPALSLYELSPDDDRADFMRAAKPGNTGAASSILLMIDTSRSMAGRRLSMAKRTAIEAIDRALRSNSEIAVLAFSGDCIRPISKWFGFSIDRERLVEFIASLTARGEASLGNALREAAPFLEKAKSPSSQSQTLLLFAHGHDNCVNIPVMTPELREKDPETRHKTIVLGIVPGRSETRRLKRIANIMGGQYLSARIQAKMTGVFHDAMDSMDMLDMLGQFGGGTRPGAPARPLAGRQTGGEDAKPEPCRPTESIPHGGRRYEKFCGTATVNGQQYPAIYICGASDQWVRSNIYDLQDGIRECRAAAEQSRAGQGNPMQRVFNNWE